MKKYLRIVVLVAVPVLLLGLLYLRSRAGGVVEVNSGYRVLMGTFSRVIVIAPSQSAAQRCIEAAFDVQDRVESLMSYHREDSELSKINRYAAERPVPVSDWMFEVLQEAVRFHELSEGAFDVTVGPLMDLWRRAGKTNVLPTEEALAEARRKVGSDKLILDPKNRTVRFAVEGMRVDLGGIAKGYAVDKAVEAMIKRGARGGLVDLGGNIRVFGRAPAGQERWRIGLQDPNVAPDQFGGSPPLLVLEMTDASVATSGHYRRFTKVQGQTQSHILNPRTGAGAGALASDTIIAPDAISADALSTAVSVLGLEKGLALIERLPAVEVILIPSDNNAVPIFSRGAESYLASANRAVPPLENR
ncbi:MAG: FAD:protein FMN transferase [Planctomycetes bacterium]|nr:FAD:protein FMN transferase [Planctomycetota bacterium]